MKPHRRARGFTLVELLLATAVLALVTSALVSVLRALDSGFVSQRSEATTARGANFALGRMDRYGRTAVAVLFPAAGDSSADSVVFTAGIDDDRDARVNEDRAGDPQADGRPGVKDVDDDGDGLIDEDAVGRTPGQAGYGGFVINVGVTAIPNDDDEDGKEDEDPVNRVTYRWKGAGVIEEDVDGQHATVASGQAGFMAYHRVSASGVHYAEIRVKFGSTGDPMQYYARKVEPVNDGRVLGARSDQ